jgi:ATP phosphoribosyltransferase
VSDYQLVDSQGATEGTVANLTAEAIADITSSGSTLKANHLKLLSDGVLLKSQATVFASRTADWTDLSDTIKNLCQKMDWKELVF